MTNRSSARRSSRSKSRITRQSWLNSRQQNRDGLLQARRSMCRRRVLQRKIDGYLQVAQESGGGKTWPGFGGRDQGPHRAAEQIQGGPRPPAVVDPAGPGVTEAFFVPAMALMRLSPTEFPLNPKAFLAAPRNDAAAAKRMLRSLAAFNATPARSRVEDVAEIYKEVFAKPRARRKAYLDASAKATQRTGEPVSTPEMVRSHSNAVQILPASELTTERIREFSQHAPATTRRPDHLLFAKINELELTHPGAPARAMLVADAPRAKKLTGLHPRPGRSPRRNRSPPFPRNPFARIATAAFQGRQRTPRTRAEHRQQVQPADRAGHRQPRLDASLRRRLRAARSTISACKARRLPTRNCSITSRAISWSRAGRSRSCTS